MRVAIAVEGTRGDVYPMLALSRSLIGAGHAVRLCAPPDFAEVCAATGAEFVSLRTPVRSFIESSADAIDRGGLSMMREIGRWSDMVLENQFAVLPDAVADCERVFTAGTVVAGASAAELHGVRCHNVIYTPALLPSGEHTPPIGELQLRSRRMNRLVWTGARIMMNAMMRGRVNGHRRRLGLASVRHVLDHTIGASPVVAVDRPLAPVPDDCSLDWRQIRCLHPAHREPLPDKLESFLAQGPPPVYIGFGSMPAANPEATTRRLLEATEEIGCRAILSQGWAGIGEAALPDGVITIGAVDHSSLFPRAAVVVHHGGAGTTHSAARAGVPQLIVPHALDQFYFARRVTDLGVGVAGPRVGRLDVPSLVERLRALLDNELVAERAQKLGQALEALGPIEPDVEALLAWQNDPRQAG